MSPTPKVSVVIPSYNGARTMASTLDALDRQTLPREQFEVIVVDDASGDDTASIAEAGGAVVVRLAENAGVAAARNRGIAEAVAPVIAFIDDDCTADPDWLRALTEPFADESVDGVGGQILPEAPDGLLLRYLRERNPWTPLPADLLRSPHPLYRLWLYLRTLGGGGRSLRDWDRLFAVAGGNMAFRTPVLSELGGFDEAERTAEETDLCRRAHRRPGGARLVYRALAVVRHHFRPHLGEVLRRARWYGEGAARFAARHDDVHLIVFPIPVLVGASAISATVSGRTRLLWPIVVLPSFMYFGWPLLALRRRQFEPLLYAYLQLAQETATMAGEVGAFRSGTSGPSGTR
jgi:glycosyltransferase involved in cell wall biosynthesis